jgi:hypothetical protein
LKAASRTEKELVAQARYWEALLIAIPALLAALVWFIETPSVTLTAALIFG